MGSLRDFLIDVGRNAYGLGENVASLGSAAIAEPVAGYAAMFDPVNGAQAIREGMTYQPRTEAGRMYQQGAATTLGAMVKPAMPVIDAWQQGVDIAGRYSPMAGAALQTVPTALGVALGAKPTLQAGRQASNTLGAMQARMIANANAPRTLNTGFMGQRGSVGIQRPLTEFEQAHLIAQQNAALPVSQGGLGLAPDNTAMDRARALGFDVDNPMYHGTGADIKEFNNDFLGVNTNAPSAKKGHFFAETPHTAGQYARSSSPVNVDDRLIIDKLTQQVIERFNGINGLPDDFKIKSLEDLKDYKNVIEKMKKEVYEKKTGNWLNEKERDKIKRLEAMEAQWENVSLNAAIKQKEYLLNKYGDEYRLLTPRTGANINPVLLRKDNPLIKDFEGKMYRDETYSSLMDKAINGGFDSVEFRNTFDPGDVDLVRTPENINAIFDPKNIRSRFAAFDPMKKNLSDLLAQNAGFIPSAGLMAYLYGQQQDGN